MLRRLLTTECYKLKILELIKRNEPYIRLIQENSIENSVQNNLLYILKPHSLCVVATTRHSRTNDLTTSKALQWAIK